MIARALVDTGPLVAIFSKSDQYHSRCMDQLRTLSGPLLTCWPVIAEAAWRLRHDGAALKTLLACCRGKPLAIATLTEFDLPDISALLAKYRDLGLQLADACVLHLANREGIQTVFTLDRRDFEVVRLKSGKRLNIIP